MAVNAKFAADFQSFDTAVENATVTLRKFASEPAKVESALARMTDSFSGRRLIEEATLAAEAFDRLENKGSLTTAELQRIATQAAAAAEKLRLMGADVPEKIAALAAKLEPLPKQLTLAQQAAEGLRGTFGQMTAALGFTNLLSLGVSTLKNFATNAIETAGRTVDLAKAYDVSTGAIQRWSAVVAQGGGTMEGIGKALKNLETDWAKNRQAVTDLGLSYSALNAATQEVRFEAVIEALGKMTNASERNRIGAAIMGKAWADLAPSAVDNFKKISDATKAASDDSVQALDRAGDAWERFKTRATNATTEVLGTASLIGEGASKKGWLASLGALLTNQPILRELEDIGIAQAKLAEEADKATKSTGGAATAMHNYVQELSDARGEVAGLTTEQRKQIAAAQELGVSTKEIADAFDLSETAIRKLNEQTKIQEDLMGKGLIEKAVSLADAMQRLTNSGLKPTKSSFEEIATAARAAQVALEDTGRAVDPLWNKLEKLRTSALGLTSTGLIPDLSERFRGFASLTPPDLATTDLASNGLIQDARARIEMEDAIQAAMAETFDATEQQIAAQTQVGAAAKQSTDVAIAGYGGLKQAALEAAAAMKIAIPEGFDWTQAYKDSGFFVNDAANRRPFAGGEGQGGAAYWGMGGLSGGAVTLNIDAREGNFNNTSSVEALADRVMAALQQRMGR